VLPVYGFRRVVIGADEMSSAGRTATSSAKNAAANRRSLSSGGARSMAN
jgi:hypothetical protein